MRSCCCRLSSRRFCATLFFSLLLVVSADRRAMAPVDALTQIYEINEKQYANRNLIYGDVVLSPRQKRWRRFRNAATKAVLAANGTMRSVLPRHIAIKETPTNRWPDNVIPFRISTKYLPDESAFIAFFAIFERKNKLLNAFKTLEKNSCFTFVPRTDQVDYLYFDKLEGCFSFVGKIGGRQLVSLATGCLHNYIIWHEVMHALGLEHEHQRPDRDRFIRIQYHNVDKDKILNFELIPESTVDLYHDYDYASIMHYDGTAFGRIDARTKQPLVTMVPLKAGVELTDNLRLTALDAEKLRILGRCDEESARERGSGIRRFASSSDESASDLTDSETWLNNLISDRNAVNGLVLSDDVGGKGLTELDPPLRESREAPHDRSTMLASISTNADEEMPPPPPLATPKTPSAVDNSPPERSATTVEAAEAGDDPRFACANRTPAICERFVLRGYCENQRLASLMRLHCRRSCGWCDDKEADVSRSSTASSRDLMRRRNTDYYYGVNDEGDALDEERRYRDLINRYYEEYYATTASANAANAARQHYDAGGYRQPYNYHYTNYYYPQQQPHYITPQYDYYPYTNGP